MRLVWSFSGSMCRLVEKRRRFAFTTIRGDSPAWSVNRIGQRIANFAWRQRLVFHVRSNGGYLDVLPAPSFDDDAEAAALGNGAMDLRSVASPGFFA